MKQMTIIEVMDGFLKGKYIPSDLKVNETNAEYLVRKFGELESKLETALRECRSAGITIDNLEAKCAALATDNEKAMETMRQSDAAVKLAHEKFSAMAAENAGMKFYLRNGPVIRKGDELVAAHQFAPETTATDAFLAEVRAQGVDMARNAMIDFVDGEVGPNKNVPGLIRGAEICVSIAELLRKGGNQ